jgi:hypothetical protein
MSFPRSSALSAAEWGGNLVTPDYDRGHQSRGAPADRLSLYLGAVLHESCRNSGHRRGQKFAQLLAPKRIKNFSPPGCFTLPTVAQTWSQPKPVLAPRRRDRQGEPNCRRSPGEPLSTRRPRTEDRGRRARGNATADERDEHG